jgi:hypothetical protein
MLEHHADARAIRREPAAGEGLSAAAEADLLRADANGPRGRLLEQMDAAQ